MVDPVAARRGRAVAFLGNGVNDALAVHAADVGLPVDPAAAVAKGAAEGRRILATTIKYVLMGPSSNFGNMCSAAAAAAACPFQILLNESLYGASQLASRPIGRIPSSCARRRTETCT